jgi:phosphoenolpyruvate carboxykinase (ATP)
MITAALTGALKNVAYNKHEVFGLEMPATCPDVPDEILSPKNTWANKEAYDLKASELAEKFNKNFENFMEFANEEILAAAPRAIAKVG